jgi:5-formyltetrahydrofolate cyclo-ligase
MDLRKTLRKKRRALSDAVRHTAALNLFSQFLKLPFIKKIQHIAVYMPFEGEGEIDPVFIINWGFENNKFLCLPKIDTIKNNKILKFLLFKKDNILKFNRFNILEPEELEAEEKQEKQNIILPEHLDLILLPLVAFDRQGHRLGMGKGYYDATLRSVIPAKAGIQKKPYLIGLGYDFQCVENIIPHENDVHLDGILTDKEMILLER